MSDFENIEHEAIVEEDTPEAPTDQAEENRLTEVARPGTGRIMVPTAELHRYLADGFEEV